VSCGGVLVCAVVYVIQCALLCRLLLITPSGDLDGVAYLQKYTTLEHMQADQVAKLQSDIIYRRMVEVQKKWSL
jgi:hypothetical protein